MGGGWLGGGWQGGGWQGGGWQGGGWSGGGGSGTPVFAMRADKPLADFAVPRYVAATYPDYPGRCWDADLWALSLLPEFFRNRPGNRTWDSFINLPGPPTMAVTLNEINRLLVLAVTERPEAMGEIIQQHQNFQVAWLHLLSIDAETSPNTFLLMKLVARVGEVVMIHYKRIHHRTRPSQICPTLYPPVPVPGHASYPAGHALLSHLTSIALMEFVPAPLHAALLELARIVGFNREVAGLHYESDSTAGIHVANQVLPLLNDCPTYLLVKGKAAAEW